MSSKAKEEVFGEEESKPIMPENKINPPEVPPPSEKPNKPSKEQIIKMIEQIIAIVLKYYGGDKGAMAIANTFLRAARDKLKRA
jgi:hypothetical protein